MNKIFIIDDCNLPPPTTICPIKANIITACDSDNTILLTSGATIFNKTIIIEDITINGELNSNIIPSTDNTLSLGSQSRRFRDINTYSGSTTIWSVSQVVNTPEINLGLDSMSESRIINANNSIIQNDCLLGGTY